MFLDKVFSVLKSEAKKEIAKNIVENLIQDKFPNNEATSSSSSAYTPASAPKPTKTCISPEELKRRIKLGLDSIAGITYQSDVPAGEIDACAHPAAKPIAFIVSKNGAPVLAIAVVALNTYKSMPVKGTQNLIEAKGINYIRFFVERENNIDYITDRISKNL